MNQTPEPEFTQRYYLIATYKQLAASGVGYATAVEYIHEKRMFLIRSFSLESIEWVVDKSPTWARRFYAETNISPIAIYDHDVVRNEEYSTLVTYPCDKRIYTPEMNNIFKQIMQDIGYKKPVFDCL